MPKHNYPYPQLPVDLNRNYRNILNDNYKRIENDFRQVNTAFDDVVATVSGRAFDQVVDAAKIEWLEPVDTYNDIKTTYPDVEEGKAVMVRDTGNVYRWNGTTWAEVMNINANPINEVDNRLSSQLAEMDNEWLRTLGDGIYVAHKGFNGTIATTTTNGVVPSNSHLAFELAGELGYKVVETDVQLLGDGTWVICHDDYTGTTLSGENTKLCDMTLEDFKKRTHTKEYVSNGYSWGYSSDLLGHTPLTLKEFLLIAKKYGYYVMPEIKWSDYHSYTDSDWESFAEIVKKVGMEDRTIVFSAYNGWVKNIIKHLPSSIACTTVSATEEFATYRNQFKKFLGSVSESSFTESMETFCKNHNIPVVVWTVDNYENAQKLFKRGVKLVITNVLGSNYDLSGYDQKIKYNAENLSQFAVTKSDGDSTLNNGVITFTTSNYNSRYIIIPRNNLKRGDIIKVTATAEIDKAHPNAVARTFVNNGLASLNKKEMLANFTGDGYETKEIYYVVEDSSQHVNISFGITSSGGVISTGKFKNIEVAVYSKDNSLALSNERYGMVYQYGNGSPTFRNDTVNKGLTKVYVDPTDSALLCIEYSPFAYKNGNPVVFPQVTDYSTNYKYRAIPVTDNATESVIKLKVLKDDGTPVTDVSANLNMAINVLIKN